MQLAKWVTLLLSCICLSSNVSKLMVNGDSFTSSYLRPRTYAGDMPIDHPAFDPPKGYNAPEQVHLTQGDLNGKAVIISWVTPHEPGSNKVYYGTSTTELNHSAKATNMTSYSFTNYKSGYIHHCLVDNLQYDTTYYYRIGKGPYSRQFSFQTPPEIGPDSSYTFGLIGDLGQSFDSLSTFQHYMQSEGKTVLFLGDFSYADNYFSSSNSELIGKRWDTWGRMIEPNTAYQPWIWTVGNHDLENFPSVFPGLRGPHPKLVQYTSRYPTPYLASGSTDPLYYSIRRASAHIIVISSYSPFVTYTDQFYWLAVELIKVNRTETPWLIVTMHVPLYSTNVAHYMQGESMRALFEKWFIEYKVDLVLAGHVHAYERSHRVSNAKYNISNGACTPELDEDAPMYIINGDGGNSGKIADEYIHPQPHYSAFREGSYGYGILDIKNKTHAYYHWHRNHNGDQTVADSVVLHNQYWKQK